MYFTEPFVHCVSSAKCAGGFMVFSSLLHAQHQKYSAWHTRLSLSSCWMDDPECICPQFVDIFLWPEILIYLILLITCLVSPWNERTLIVPKHAGVVQCFPAFLWEMSRRWPCRDLFSGCLPVDILALLRPWTQCLINNISCCPYTVCLVPEKGAAVGWGSWGQSMSTCPGPHLRAERGRGPGGSPLHQGHRFIFSHMTLHTPFLQFIDCLSSFPWCLFLCRYFHF